MRKRPILSIVLVALPLGLLFVLFLPTVHWDGAVVFAFPTTVQDAVSGRPVTHAGVRILRQRRESDSNLQDMNLNNPPSTTDATGHTEVAWAFGAGGRSYLFWKTGSASFRSWNLEVTADGYEALVTPLSTYAGDRRSIRRSKSIPITVQLKPISTSTSSSPAP